ncbi:class I SAM-dependent methyltransferase [Natranaerobius thermophilus]|uniref:Methyltransferase type 12 n=1 Tax=Natranaerobius thermophilus (strain ATCC BAA-1301 / DSM 18059 / JW/NM-WN-LF) TaxID=457570 RepID=B2A112_NATTJ|nr:class I SAM-dependent methyltransferase [Natranaerobius thermophilus]ACB84635.1 Methyltransferase type 12 [Natranaerobius thermophilus JW/NM-WN-LF]
MKKEDIYNLPKYYDIAFSWDLSEEIYFLLDVFKKNVPFEVNNVLEPACGTGRYLIELPKYKNFSKIVGYDLNPEMVEYSNDKIKDKRLQEIASVAKDDMITAKFSEQFDLAINMINSIGYITKDEDILQHFRNTGECVKKDGLYIVQLNCAYSSFEKPMFVEWEMQSQGTKVKMKWTINSEDRKNKLSYQSSKMEVIDIDKDKKFKIEDEHVMRLWLFEDLKNLFQKSGLFKLISIYDKEFKEVNMTKEINGEMGNLYFVLKRI